MLLNIKRITFLVVTALALGGLSVPAQEADGLSDSATVHFSQSHANISLSLSENRTQLDSIVGFIHRNNALNLRRVHVTGGASPEGSYGINETLSRRRADAIFDYISRREAMPDSVTSFTYIGRDWRGLRSMVEADTRVPYRSEVLRILDQTIAAGDNDAAASNRGLARLRSLHGGVPYGYMYSRFFPGLRASRVYVQYEAPAFLAPDPVELIDTLPADTVPVPVIVEDVPDYALGSVNECRPFYMGLKTNMLYDLAALPSVGAEFYLGKNWSAGINWTYGWWSKDRKHRYWRAYGGDINVRRWFGSKAKDKPLTGHHLGVYFGVVTYDFEFGGKGYMGGLPHRTLWDRCNYTGGIEYGYSLPVGRRLNIDFTNGLGYIGGKYLEYEPQGNAYVWQKTRRLSRFAPTKAEISLVWLIGCDNYNRNHKKGGEK